MKCFVCENELIMTQSGCAFFCGKDTTGTSIKNSHYYFKQTEPKRTEIDLIVNNNKVRCVMREETSSFLILEKDMSAKNILHTNINQMKFSNKEELIKIVENILLLR
jgi:hypothetical protein